MPAASSAPNGTVPRAGSLARTWNAHIQRSGAARAVRQKALATGPASERRTKMGAKAMAQPPASSAMKGSCRMGRPYHSGPMTTEFFSAVLILLLVCDPFGNVPLVNAMLAETAPTRRRRVILREVLIATAILAVFMAFGRELLGLMHLSETSLSIAGGVILFMIAIRMVFAHPEGAFGTPARGEPFIVPLAIPLIAGPSALATVMLMATREPAKLGMWAGALALTMALTALILVTGDRMQRFLGERVMQAVERLMGLILTAIAVEMLLGGIRAFVQGLR